MIVTGAGAYQLAFTPDGSQAWVVDTGANNVREVDTATGQPGVAVTVGNAPDGIAITPAAAGSQSPAAAGGRSRAPAGGQSPAIRP